VYGDEEISRHVGGVRGREDAWRRGVTGAGFWSLLGIGLWIVETTADARTVGYVGFFDFQRDISPSIAGEPEMGWMFGHGGQGRGYATEAGTAALGWLDQTFGAISVPAIIGFENYASMRLAERLGFVRQPDALYRGEPLALFRRPAR
jgi:RimJ/RimL family protein N-acetyltransferase